MPGKERDYYRNLNKEALLKILDRVPKKDIRYAMIYEKVIASKEKSPKRLFEKEFREFVGSDLPEHKKEWYLDAVDLIARSIKYSPEKKLTVLEIEEVAGLSGLFAKEYVDPQIKELYDAPVNWVEENIYEDDFYRRYIGPYNLQKAVTEDSKFSKDDFWIVIRKMVSKGFIEETREMHTGLNYSLRKRK